MGDTGGYKDSIVVSHSHNHNLSGSTNNTGNHSHNVSGNSNNTGSHSHNRDKWGGNFGGSSGATVFRSDANGNRSTGNAGAHSHTISGNTNNTGAHSHNVSISGYHSKWCFWNQELATILCFVLYYEDIMYFYEY